MNATTIDCDQTEEEILNLFTYEVSDEALEAAAGGGGIFCVAAAGSDCGVKSAQQTCYVSC
jgi:hypothetical protein